MFASFGLYMNLLKQVTFKRQLRPGAQQIIERPASEQEPELVHAADPSGKS